jgi:uncharacterized membrane protein YgcG
MKKVLLLALLAVSSEIVAKERVLKLFSAQDFNGQIGQQELTIALLYHGKDHDQRRVLEAFKRANNDPTVRGIVAFVYADLDHYDLDEVLTQYKLTEFPAYMLFRTTYDDKAKKATETLTALNLGQSLNVSGIVNFILQFFEKEITTIRQAQLKQARLRAQAAEARRREMEARYPNIYYGFGPYYGWGYGYPGYGYGFGWGGYYGGGWGGYGGGYYRGGGYRGGGGRGGGGHGGRR